MKTDEYTLTPLSNILTSSATIRNLTSCGIKSLEDCAKAGSRRLLQIKRVGFSTIVVLRKECRKRRICWEKDKNEWEQHDKLKARLIREYGLSGPQAEQICDIHFNEGWR